MQCGAVRVLCSWLFCCSLEGSSWPWWLWLCSGLDQVGEHRAALVFFDLFLLLDYNTSGDACLLSFLPNGLLCFYRRYHCHYHDHDHGSGLHDILSQPALSVLYRLILLLYCTSMHASISLGSKPAKVRSWEQRTETG